MLRLTVAFLLLSLSAFGQGTQGILRCATNSGLDVHATREPGSPIVARIQCGSPVLLIDSRFGSAHIRTEDGNDGYIIGLNLGQWSFEPEQSQPASAVNAQPQTPQVRPQAVTVTPAAPVQALSGSEEFPRVEVFGGFSLLRPSIPSDILGGTEGLAASNVGEFILGNVIGWGSSATVNFTRNFGITGDVSGFYRKLGDIRFEDVTANAKLDLHAFLGGPTFKARLKSIEPFGHALFGIGRASASAFAQQGLDRFNESVSDHAFVMAIGGGIDVPVGRLISLRPIEADYFPYRTNDGSVLTFNNFRWRTGVVFKFGR